MLPYSPFTKPSLSEMQSQATFVILSSRTLVIFSNFFHQIHQKGTQPGSQYKGRKAKSTRDILITGVVFRVQ